MSRLRIPLSLLICLFFAHSLLADEADDREAVRAEVEYLTATGYLGGSDVEIAAPGLIAEVYENRNFSPAWNDYDQIGELITAIESTEAEGLDPADYLLEAVRSANRDLQAGITDPTEKAVADIVLTESLIRVCYHQLFGKVNPRTLDANWNFSRDIDDLDPATAVQQIIDSPSLTRRIQALVPRGWVYQGLKSGLAAYREIEAEGGWPLIPEGPTLHPGAADERIAVLARRLTTTGDLEDPARADSTTYDASVEEAVRRFQKRHGIDVDGVIGAATLRALNVPVDQRVRQLEISLERARWVLKGLEDDFVLVNIAGFEAYRVRGREIVWRTRVQVGRAYRQSPVFRDEMKYLVFNPTWTVPYSIATKDILRQVQQDPDYFEKRGFVVKNRSGEVIDPSSVDWSQVTRSNFPYTLVQGPGPHNALGRVKFMFPNEHAVYLHDTPSQSLFGRAQRTFSSGCIRVENPFELAEELLGSKQWTQERIQEVLDSGEITTAFLPEPLPVLLLYFTALVSADGTVIFYNDVYDRDQAIAEALDEPFRLEATGS